MKELPAAPYLAIQKCGATELLKRVPFALDKPHCSVHSNQTESKCFSLSSAKAEATFGLACFPGSILPTKFVLILFARLDSWTTNLAALCLRQNQLGASRKRIWREARPLH